MQRKNLKNLLDNAACINTIRYIAMGSIVLWALEGIWWLFLVWAVIAILYGIIISRYNFKNMSCICPKCHEIFKPEFKEAFGASHTNNPQAYVP